ncbi:hypothetical protein GCM10018777_61200 [Streptomyces albogriseolus]|nr:hypothetical protein GCM10018777_61200 [Streptomyces viridodiastaticus]
MPRDEGSPDRDHAYGRGGRALPGALPALGHGARPTLRPSAPLSWSLADRPLRRETAPHHLIDEPTPFAEVLQEIVS